MNQFNIFDCLGEGWEYFKQKVGLAIGGYLLYTVVSFVGGFIPILNIVFQILILPPLVAGFVLLGLNLARNSNPRIEDLFAGFKYYGKAMGAYWLLVLAFVVGMLPSVIVGLIGFASGDDPSAAIIVLMIINSIIVGIWVLRWAMVFYLIMDIPEIGVIDAFKESARIMKGHIPMVIVFGIVCTLISAVALVLLVLPYLFLVAPWLLVAWSRVYVRLKELADGAASTTGSEPAPVVG